MSRLPPSAAASPEHAPLPFAGVLAGAWALAEREIVRFVRQRQRLVGALGQPLLFWLLFGAGFGPTFRLGDDAAASPTYAQFFFPGVVTLIVLFTAIFASFSLIEDRREGFLQGVLVSPLPRWGLVLGKLLGGSLLAVLQAGVFLLLGLTVGVQYSVASLALVVLWLWLVALGLTALGFVVAWRMDSTQGFHAVMSLLLLPLWFLSGAFFPTVSGGGWGPTILARIAQINPLTYGVAGLRHLLFPAQAAALPAGAPGLPLCAIVVGMFAVGLFALSWRMAQAPARGDLQ